MPPYLRTQKNASLPALSDAGSSTRSFPGLQNLLLLASWCAYTLLYWLCQILFPWVSTGKLRTDCPTHESVDRLTG